MTLYGNPDFWRPPRPAGQTITGSKGYTAAAMTFPMDDVSDYGVLGIRLRPTGTITGYALVLSFYDDAAGTRLIEQYAWHSFNGAYIIDNIVPPSAHVQVAFTPGATGGGQTFDYYMIGWPAHVPPQMVDGGAVLANYVSTVGAGVQEILFTSTVHAGPALLNFNFDAAAWVCQVGGFSWNTGPLHYAFLGDNTVYPHSFTQQLILGRYTYRVFVANQDGVTRNLNITLIQA